MLLTKGYALQMKPLYVDDVSNNLETDACCLLWVRNEIDRFCTRIACLYRELKVTPTLHLLYIIII